MESQSAAPDVTVTVQGKEYAVADVDDELVERMSADEYAHYYEMVNE